jgi:hypothetical protein
MLCSNEIIDYLTLQDECFIKLIGFFDKVLDREEDSRNEDLNDCFVVIG